MSELAQAVQVLTMQIPAFAETSVDQTRKIRVGLEQNRSGLDALYQDVQLQTQQLSEQRDKEVTAVSSSNTVKPENSETPPDEVE